jgi:hypothetical protein
MLKFEERRIFRRTQQSYAVKLKIVFSSDNPRALGQVLDASTVDVSASGLRLSMPQSLSVGSTIDINVTLDRDFREYYLSAKVRWCKQMDDGSYQAGAELQDTSETPTDYRAWKMTFK